MESGRIVKTLVHRYSRPGSSGSVSLSFHDVGLRIGVAPELVPWHIDKIETLVFENILCASNLSCSVEAPCRLILPRSGLPDGLADPHGGLVAVPHHLSPPDQLNLGAEPRFQSTDIERIFETSLRSSLVRRCLLNRTNARKQRVNFLNR